MSLFKIEKRIKFNSTQFLINVDKNKNDNFLLKKTLKIIPISDWISTEIIFIIWKYLENLFPFQRKSLFTIWLEDEKVFDRVFQIYFYQKESLFVFHILSFVK